MFQDLYGRQLPHCGDGFGRDHDNFRGLRVEGQCAVQARAQTGCFREGRLHGNGTGFHVTLGNDLSYSRLLLKIDRRDANSDLGPFFQVWRILFAYRRDQFSSARPVYREEEATGSYKISCVDVPFPNDPAEGRSHDSVREHGPGLFQGGLGPAFSRFGSLVPGGDVVKLLAGNGTFFK